MKIQKNDFEVFQSPLTLLDARTVDPEKDFSAVVMRPKVKEFGVRAGETPNWGRASSDRCQEMPRLKIDRKVRMNSETEASKGGLREPEK